MDVAEELGEGDSLVGDNNIEIPSPHRAVDDSTSVPPPLLVCDAVKQKQAARMQQMKGLEDDDNDNDNDDDEDKEK